MQKFFVNNAGDFIGSFDGAEPPKNSIEVPIAPEYGDQKWNKVTNKWGPRPAQVTEKSDVEVITNIMLKKGLVTTLEINLEKGL